MLQKSQSKKVWQLKYLLLLPLILGMLAYTSSSQKMPANEQVSNVGQNTNDSQLVIETNNWIDNQADFALVKARIELSATEANKNYILTREEYFKMQLLKKRQISILFTEFATIRSEKNTSLHQIATPTTADYNSYVSRKKAFQILDPNLKISIDQKALDIRIVVKEDKNLGPGEFMTVKDLRDLTGDEILKFNRMLAHIDFENRFLFISDGRHAFLITKKWNQRLESPKSKAKNTDDKFNQRKEEKVTAKDTQFVADKTLFKLLEEKRIKGVLRDKYKSSSRQPKTIPFGMVDEVPIFPGCEDAIDKRACFLKEIQRHISENFNYPKEAEEEGLEGQVGIMFTIDEHGNVSNIRRKGLFKLLSDEAVRIISLLPQMQPGKHEENIAKVVFSIPISFELSSSDFVPKNEISYNVGPEVRRLQKRYNELAEQRNILNDKPEENAKAIKDLDEKLFILKIQIREVLNKKTLEIMGVPFAEIEEVPIFPGCEEAENKRDCFRNSMQEHIAKHFKYPTEAQKQGIQGRVSIMFTIDEEGNITKIRKRGPAKSLESEAERIIKLLPRMQAGKQKGKAVKVPFSIPITFKLNSEAKQNKE